MWSNISPRNTQDFGDGSWLWEASIPAELRYTIATIVGLMVVLGIATVVILSHQRSVASAISTTNGTESTQHTPVVPTSEPVPVESNNTQQSATTDVHASIDTTGVIPQTDLQVNGQQVPVPDSGSVTQTVVGPDDTTSVNLNVQSQSSSSGTTNSSTNLQITTQSTNETSMENSE